MLSVGFYYIKIVLEIGIGAKDIGKRRTCSESRVMDGIIGILDVCRIHPNIGEPFGADAFPATASGEIRNPDRTADGGTIQGEVPARELRIAPNQYLRIAAHVPGTANE